MTEITIENLLREREELKDRIRELEGLLYEAQKFVEAANYADTGPLKRRIRDALEQGTVAHD